MNLMIVSGECEVKWNGSKKICKVYEEERNMKNV
jgi:hypothetical protein